VPPSLPPIPARPDNRECRWHSSPMPRIAFSAGAIGAAVNLPQGIMICAVCDMVPPHAGPPVLLDYIRKGHR
jgi:hypothetical protein